MTPERTPRAARTGAARFIATDRGVEVRCPQHGHLLGVFRSPGRLEIKCRSDEYVIVEVIGAPEPSPGEPP